MIRTPDQRIRVFVSSTLQELGPEHAQAIEQAFADDYEALVLHPEQPANRGIGLLSRYPVRDEEVFQLTPDSLPALRATLDVDGVPVTVLVVHLPAAKYDLLPPQYDDSARNAALDALIQDYLEPESGPVLLLCDCNTAAYSDKYNELDDRLDDAFAQVGRGLGFSYGFDNAPEPPAFRIDFVWHSAAFVPQEARGWSSSGTSDHRPMVADLVLDRRAAP